MLNNAILVGRVLKLEMVQEGDKVLGTVDTAHLDLAVVRNYKNEEGIYETDFIRCVLKNKLATNTTEYCKKGDVVGIKGRLENNRTTEDPLSNELHVVAEKVTFLSSKGEEK